MLISQRIKFVSVVPIQKITNTTVSAKTAGTGGVGSKGIIDTQGYQRVLIVFRKGTGTSKLKTAQIGFQSGATTLFASTTVFSGLTSGIVFSGKTSSGAWAVDINLPTIGNAKRYINAKVVTSTTSCPMCVDAYLYNGEQFPPTATGYATLTRYG